MEDGTVQREEAPAQGDAQTITRLNWGCGEEPVPNWINSDIKAVPGIDLPCDIVEGLPLPDDTLDYAVSVHALPEINYRDLVAVLRELRRVLKPGGTLRLVLPDLDKGIRAYLNNDEDYFLIPDEDARAIGAKFVVQMIWYGYSRSLFTYDYTEEILRKAGFSEVARCEFRQTVSRYPEIVELDSREKESLFVEATK